jgi:hypothetical protein
VLGLGRIDQDPNRIASGRLRVSSFRLRGNVTRELQGELIRASSQLTT